MLKELVAQHPSFSRYLDEVDWKVEEIYGSWLRRQ